MVGQTITLNKEEDEILWEKTCDCGEHLAVIIKGGEIYPERLYRDIKCNNCGKHHEV